MDDGLLIWPARLVGRQGLCLVTTMNCRHESRDDKRMVTKVFEQLDAVKSLLTVPPLHSSRRSPASTRRNLHLEHTVVEVLARFI